MSVIADVNKAYYDHLHRHNRKPDTVYLTETSFLYLILEMVSLNPESSQFQRMLRLVKREGAVQAAKKIRYKDMHIVVQERGKLGVHVRDNKHVRPDDTKLDLSENENDEQIKGIFGQVFGRGGIFDRVFGRH